MVESLQEQELARLERRRMNFSSKVVKPSFVKTRNRLASATVGPSNGQHGRYASFGTTTEGTRTMFNTFSNRVANATTNSLRNADSTIMDRTAPAPVRPFSSSTACGHRQLHARRNQIKRQFLTTKSLAEARSRVTLERSLEDFNYKRSL